MGNHGTFTLSHLSDLWNEIREGTRWTWLRWPPFSYHTIQSDRGGGRDLIDLDCWRMSRVVWVVKPTPEVARTRIRRGRGSASTNKRRIRDEYVPNQTAESCPPVRRSSRCTVWCISLPVPLKMPPSQPNNRRCTLYQPLGIVGIGGLPRGDR